ncbi:MAG: YbhB/YbcL family Raf kinase inhibitor-like protein [bacterium]
MSVKKTTLLATGLLALATFLTGGSAMALELRSSAFTNASPIPSKYTCDGSDLSPPLSWSGAPAGTKSFALIADDPDAPAGTWVHWVAWNIPTATSSLGEAMTKDAQLPDGTKQGVTDFRRPGYGGPCPPSGTHRYFFKLYALDAPLDLPATATKPQLEAAMKGHVLAQTQLMGTYSRQR